MCAEHNDDEWILRVCVYTMATFVVNKLDIMGNVDDESLRYALLFNRSNSAVRCSKFIKLIAREGVERNLIKLWGS